MSGATGRAGADRPASGALAEAKTRDLIEAVRSYAALERPERERVPGDDAPLCKLARDLGLTTNHRGLTATMALAARELLYRFEII